MSCCGQNNGGTNGANGNTTDSSSGIGLGNSFSNFCSTCFLFWILIALVAVAIIKKAN